MRRRFDRASDLPGTNYTLRMRRCAAIITVGTLSALTASTLAGDGPCETWTAFGDGANDEVDVLGIYDDQLVAGGFFTSIDGQSASRIARFDGSDWHPFNAGLPGVPRTFLEHNGLLYVGGGFTSAGDVNNVSYIAQWNGSAWNYFDGDPTAGMNGPVHALTVYNGDIVAAGQFTMAGQTPANYIARWDGTSWQPFGDGMGGSQFTRVYDVAVYNGELIAGGEFPTADGRTVNHLARWDGNQWQPFGSGVGGVTFANVRAMTIFECDLVIGGNFTEVDGVEAFVVARWDGTSWSPLGEGLFGPVYAMTVFGDQLVASGEFFETASGETVNHIAIWDGSEWSALETGMTGGSGFTRVYAVTAFGDNLIAGGDFGTAGSVSAENIAQWDGCFPIPCPYDLNDSGAVDVNDLLTMLGDWGPCSGCGECPSDVNKDGNIGVSDLLGLLAAWGPCP